jgi:hypothetical protein
MRTGAGAPVRCHGLGAAWKAGAVDGAAGVDVGMPQRQAARVVRATATEDGTMEAATVTYGVFVVEPTWRCVQQNNSATALQEMPRLQGQNLSKVCSEIE